MGRLTCVFLLGASTAGYAAQAPGSSVLVTNVTVIDATGHPPRPGMNVLIESGYITAIESATRASAPATPRTTIDGSGRFLIPGLWDMHAHWSNLDEYLPSAADYLPLFVANGVTGVRLMWGKAEHHEWKARVYDDDFLTPRIVVGSEIIDGPQPIWPGSLAAKNALEGRHYVRRFHEIGSDFIKIYDELPRDVFFAIADESRELGIPFAGHVPMAIDAVEASDAGQKSFEHLVGVDLALSSDRRAIREAYAAAMTSATSPADMEAAWVAMQDRIFETYDPTLTGPLFQRFKDNGTWQTPTLTVIRSGAYFRERAVLDKERLTYLPDSIARFWHDSGSFQFEQFAEEDWEKTRRRFERAQHIVGEMHRAGVRILAGTDVLNPYCFPGFSLHDELQLLVDSGLGPMDALQAATRNAAEFSGRLDSLGTIEVGKLADLVLLDGDPLEDIANTTRIASVFFNGRVYTRESLDAMLARMKEAAR